jgi:hypothetical protein
VTRLDDVRRRAPIPTTLGVGTGAAADDYAGVDQMSKGIDRKKETKKKPAMNLMQKRAAKAEKKKNK